MLTKKENRIIVSFIVAFTMMFYLFVPVSATEVIQQDDVYVEKGQITLKNLDLSYNKTTDKLCVNEKENSISSTIEKERLINAIDSSPELYDNLKQITQDDNNELQAISYSRIFFDEKDNTFDNSPMTNAEYNSARSSINNGTPTKSPEGMFTLYTAAYIDQYTNQLFGQSNGSYSINNHGSSENPSSYYDYVSVSLPSVYLLKSSAIYTDNLSQYKTYETDSAVAYRVQLFKNGSTTSYTKVLLSAAGTSSASKTGRKVISNYMHTWGTVNASFSYNSSSGITIGATSGTAKWVLASSVILVC